MHQQFYLSTLTHSIDATAGCLSSAISLFHSKLLDMRIESTSEKIEDSPGGTIYPSSKWDSYPFLPLIAVSINQT